MPAMLLHLSRLLRLDEVTSVSIPSVSQEAARDLVRAREDCRGDLMRARHRLSKLLLRHGIVYYGGHGVDRCARSVAAHRGGTAVEAPATRMAFDADYDHVLTMQARRGRLDAAIEDIASDGEFTPIVRRVSCLRGVSTLTGLALAVEIGDWNRFTGNTIGSFVGLVPSEYSSGSSRVQGPITKTGQHPCRRLLVEAAWHHRPRYRVGAVMRSRWDQASPAARARGDEGNRRLHGRWVGFLERRKRPDSGQCGDRPRAGRLVLVSGGHGRLTAT